MRHNLSEVKELIRDRRTIYPEDYSNRKVHKEIVEAVLDNARWAPTHGMTQPWRFKIYTGDALKRLANELPDLYKKIEGENFKPNKAEKMKKRAESVSALTFICMARDKDEKIPEIEEIEAVACSVQNMLLTCTAYGLGGYWSSPKMVYDKSMNEFLGLGEKDRCLGIFYMGYPEGDWPKSHRTPLEYVTEWIDQ